jgi:error-prone DNA polymerase
MGAAMLAVKGVMQKEGEVIHVVADRLEDMTPLLHAVGTMNLPRRLASTDPDARRRAEAGGVIRVKSRDFH